MGNYFSDPRPTGPFSKNHENGRKPAFDSHVLEMRKLQPSHDTVVINRDVKSQQQAMENKAAVMPVRPNKPVTADSGPGRPPKSNVQRKSNMEPKMQQKMENNSITRRPPTAQLDVRKNLFVHYNL